jgi:hypothetical protein
MKTDITFVVGRNRYEIDEKGKPLGGKVIESTDDCRTLPEAWGTGYSGDPHDEECWRSEIEKDYAYGLRQMPDGLRLSLWHVLDRMHRLEQIRWLQFASDVIAGRCPLIVYTSHDHLADMAADYDHVIVCWGKRWKRLSEHPDAAVWKHVLEPGEFWARQYSKNTV